MIKQYVNLSGLSFVANIVRRDRRMLIPHYTTKNISGIDWRKLKEVGFKGVIFDKDNTITEPYQLKVCPIVVDALQHCKSVFGEKAAIFSNHVGTPIDKNLELATKVRVTTGLPVIPHTKHKPEGGEEVAAYFGCSTADLVMIGDRFSTDVVFGNLYGMLTIKTEALDPSKDNMMARKSEDVIVDQFRKRGVVAPTHKHNTETLVQPHDPSAAQL